MITGPDLTLRRLGLGFLAAALLLLVLGQTVLEPRLGRGLLFLVYWLACFACTGLAMLIALLDVWIIRSRARHHQEELLHSAVPNPNAAPEPRPRPSSDNRLS